MALDGCLEVRFGNAVGMFGVHLLALGLSAVLGGRVVRPHLMSPQHLAEGTFR